MPRVDVAGGALWYAAHDSHVAHDSHAAQGTGLPVLLLIHGAGGSRLDWPGALRRLPECRVLVPDLPGHGRSALPGQDSIADYAAVVSQFLAALELPPVVIVGHSMGAAVALTLALRQPERIAGLVLAGGAGALPVHPALLALLATDPERAYEWLAGRLWGEEAPDLLREQTVARLRSVDPAVLHGDYRACAAFDLRETLEAIAAPALVLAGALDRMVPPERSRALAAGLPAAELVVLPEAGHMLLLEQPAATRDAVTRWLGRRFSGCYGGEEAL